MTSPGSFQDLYQMTMKLGKDILWVEILQIGKKF